MDLDTAQNNVVAKLPLLKQGDYEMWKLRIEQYFQVQDYALWDVIENGNSFNLKNDVKARSMLLMALPNEHLLTFSQYKDGKTLFAIIHARFGGNDATKHHKIVSQLAILGENISPEDLNLKFLRSLPSEWNTHVVIVEQEVKRIVTASSSSGSQNMAFVSSPDSTNEVDTANIQVSTVSTPVSTASTNDHIANLSDATVYALLANHPNGSQLMHEDLEQMHEDDLEEMDLKWQLALLSMRARRYYQRTGKKITINRSDTAGYDKSKVECFNCPKIGHFAREYRAMIAIDGAGFDWSFMRDEEVPTNMALMTFSNSEFNKSEFDLATYKRGLASVEEQLVFYKKNEIKKLKKEKESNQIKIDNFENASKSLDKLIESQITDKSRKRVGFESYNAIAPPPTGLFVPPTVDLSKSGLEEFQQPEFEGYGFKANKSVCENSSKNTSDASIIEEWVSDCDEDESEVMVLKSNNVQHKPEQVNQPWKVSQTPRNNKTNWNNMKTRKLGIGLQFTKKACFVCGSFNHLIRDCDFYDKKMVQKPVVNNVKKETDQRCKIP
ncbi:ribonuclease H-like domain-containing protein [Tanacetum coccineum]